MADSIWTGTWTGLSALAVNSVLLLGSFWIARYGLVQPRGPAAVLATAVVFWTACTVGLEALASVRSHRGRSHAGLGRDVSRGRWGCSVAPSPDLVRDVGPVTETATVLFLGGLRPGWQECSRAPFFRLVFLMRSLLVAVRSVVSDGPIYHLFFAARWWKAGRLTLVAAPFGENAATYFPANGDLWFTWLIASWGGDRLARVGQAPFLVLAGLAAFGCVARLLGASRTRPALCATCWFVSSTLPSVFIRLSPTSTRSSWRAIWRLPTFFCGSGSAKRARPRCFWEHWPRALHWEPRPSGSSSFRPLKTLAIGGILWAQSGAATDQNRSGAGDRAGPARVGRVLVHSQRVTDRKSPISAGDSMVGPRGVARLVWSRSDAIQPSTTCLSTNWRAALRYLARRPRPQAGAALDRLIDRGLGYEKAENDGDARLDRDLLIDDGAERRALLGFHSLHRTQAAIHAPCGSAWQSRRSP